MKPLRISKQDQINALLDGSIYRLVRQHGGPEYVNLSEWLDITRSELEDFFDANPGLAEEYFRRIEPRQPSADGLKIERDRANYRVVTLTHNGTVVFPHAFDNLNDAVAAYLAWFYVIIDDVSN
jgi:hypothetical protein